MELETTLSESGNESPDVGLLDSSLHSLLDDPIPSESEFITKDSGLKVKVPEERRLELIRRQALARQAQQEKEKQD